MRFVRRSTLFVRKSTLFVGKCLELRQTLRIRVISCRRRTILTFPSAFPSRKRFATWKDLPRRAPSAKRRLRAMVWYGIVEFNVPLDTVSIGHFGDENECFQLSACENLSSTKPKTTSSSFVIPTAA